MIDRKISELTELVTVDANDLLPIVDVSVDGFETKYVTVSNLALGAPFAPDAAQYVTMQAEAGLPNERILTGTANQITVTDGGAGAAVTLSLPSAIILTGASSISTSAGNLTLDGTANTIINAGAGQSIFLRINNAVPSAVEINSSGQVGLGVTPSQILHAKHNTAIWLLESDLNTGFVAQQLYNDTNATDRIDFVNFGTAFLGAYAGVNLANLGRFVKFGNGDFLIGVDGSGDLVFSTNASAKIIVDSAGDLAFQQASTISTTAGDLTLDPAVKVAIEGTSSPVVNITLTGISGDPLTLEGDQSNIGFNFLNATQEWKNQMRDTDGYYTIRDITAGTRPFKIYEDALTDAFVIAADGDIGMLTDNPSAQLHINQSLNTAAQPVLYLRQADVDQEFIYFRGTAAAGDLTRSIIDEGDQATTTLEGWIKMFVQDDGNQIGDRGYYIPLYVLG